jgi:hypothetical protein
MSKFQHISLPSTSRTNAEDTHQPNARISKFMSFQIIAKPALNKAGLTKLTYKGFEEVDPQFDAKTGEQIKRGYTKLMFEIMDTTRKSPIKANVIGGALTGYFLKTIEALGFAMPTTDADGFNVELDGALDSDGFETEDTNATELIESLKAHLEKVNGIVLLAKVEKNKRGYWEIDTDSLQPFDK